MLPVKKKLEHISYGITRNEANYQTGMIQLMNKLLEQTRQNNHLLRRLLDDPDKKPNRNHPQNENSTHNLRKPLPAINYQPATAKNLLHYKKSENSNDLPQMKTFEAYQSGAESQANQGNAVQQETVNMESGQDDFKKMMFGFQEVLSQVGKVNRKIYEKLEDLNIKPSQAVHHPAVVHEGEKYQRALLQILEKRQKNQKKSYSHYGILSQIMPFSDKRQIKVRYKIVDLMEKSEMQNLKMNQFKQNTTEWVGMIFRATASICWNMLCGGQLNFDEVKVLFTENIIFNFIEYMKDIHSFVNEQLKLELTNHINKVSCDVLEFLCRQYPQTKIEAPNIALRKAIPKIQNQGQSKFDLVAMMCKKTFGLEPEDVIEFRLRTDKDYSSVIMKSINHMIDQTEAQFPQFQKVMTNIFEKIYLPKEKRAKLKPAEPISLGGEGVDSQYREKVKSYSSYLIGRKIPKNTPKYSKNEIQYGVFFVKAPSILRIITKWFQELWEFVNTSLQKLKASTTEIKDHQGKVLNISTRVKHALYLGVCQRLAKIKSKIERIRTECYDMQFLLADPKYTSDEKQMHLSEDQLSVGKYCSNLKNAISSYVCTKLSKLIYYLLLIPLEINEKTLNFSDEDLEQQARKHLDSASLVYLKIFDLLRCKCHSNEEEIVYIVEALKQLDRQDPKFELIRVKDRLNQGTRDIMINAQYDGGLVWQIQLSVTSRVDKKQDLLDKYNHFLYELKRSKLGPISQCVSIWSSLEQRSIYFEQLYLNKKARGLKCSIQHKKKQCKDSDYNQSFSEFKRSMICASCKQYFAIPVTSLLNARCEHCRITYCGPCYYSSLPQEEKKRFIFQNFDKRKLLNSSAYQQLQEFTDYKKPIPKQGFFIKKKFLNRQLSFYTLTKVDKQAKGNEFNVSISQAIIRGKQIDIRGFNKKELRVSEEGGKYYLKGSEKELENSDLGEIWIFSFKSKTSEKMTVDELQSQLKDPTKSKMKYLNVLFEPNYMNELKLYSKIFQKMRLISSLRSVESIEKYKIAVYRFPNLTVLAKVQVEEDTIQQFLVKKKNRSVLKQYAQKMMNIIYMEQSDLSDEIESLLTLSTDTIKFYFMKVKKLYLAGNYIKDITCFKEFKNLQSLSISKNELKSLQGIEELTQLYYIKFDQNQISSLLPFQRLIDLTYLSGNINCIDSLQGLENLQHLGSLSLCQNNITSISQLKSLSKLKRVYLRDNPIDSILAMKDIGIKHLYIGNTKVNAMQLQQMACITLIKEVSMKHLKLTAIPHIFENSLKLVELKLSKNNIRKIEHIDKAVSLQRLDLSDNQIEVMENIQALENLEVINLRNNKISKVECVKTFIQTLKVLQLELNPLDNLTEYLIYQQKPIESMRLKFTESSISAKAKEQLKNHAFELGSKSESDG